MKKASTKDLCTEFDRFWKEIILDYDNPLKLLCKFHQSQIDKYGITWCLGINKPETPEIPAETVVMPSVFGGSDYQLSYEGHESRYLALANTASGKKLVVAYRLMPRKWQEANKRDESDPGWEPEEIMWVLAHHEAGLLELEEDDTMVARLTERLHQICSAASQKHLAEYHKIMRRMSLKNFISNIWQALFRRKHKT